jgi:ribosomal protein S18 acetylase RimI-like enzyme
MTGVSIRLADTADARSIALLHADSWRRHYRGAYSDFYLDGDLESERLAVWTDRLNQPEGTITLLAEMKRRPLGFIHLRLDEEPVWGQLVDNLHVISAQQRTGIGTRLLDDAARRVVAHRPNSGMYLWVLEQNTAAQAFYRARGGAVRGREALSPPGGDRRNLQGSPAKLRIAWADPTLLLLRQ